MGPIASAIKEKLIKNFNPVHLDIIDESHKHAHHAGAKDHAKKHGSGESHFHVVIVANSFKDMNLLSRHRAVMDALSEEMDGKVHALSLEASAP
ncbi:MAG: BolA family transcriptional regulator [Robiginitomaculum sp.]|nr:BolA family transcriptional regulator [Robiginitomaculum sp.]